MPYPARFYAALHRGTPGDLEHYRRICQGATSVLELGCGYGRVLAAVASPERRVVGVDRDSELLTMAEATLDALPEDHRASIDLVEDQMQSVTLGDTFDRVLIPFGGLWCMLDDATLDATLSNAVRHLAPDGVVAFDVYRADEFHRDAEPDDVPEDAHTPLTRVEVDGVAYEVLERSTWDKAQQRIDVSYLYVDESGHMVEGTIAQRYLLEPQLRDALRRAGLRVTGLRGSFDDEPTDDAHEDELMIVEATRDAPED